MNNPQMATVASSNIKMAGYDPEVGVLRVQFRSNDKIAVYPGISQEQWDGFAVRFDGPVDGISAGQYFVMHFKNLTFTYED